MTSIADPARPGRVLATFRAALLVGALVMGALVTPAPWAWLWLAVPGTVAATILLAWRFGAWTLSIPAALFGLTAALAGVEAAWSWWIPTAAVSGVWMGLREERGERTGARAWMLLPVLVLAATLPWLPGYAPRVARLEAELRAGDAQMMEMAREMKMKPEQVEGLQRSVEVNAPLRKTLMPNLLPTLMFAWVGLLVVAGRAMAARLSDGLRWPSLTRMRFTEWRLPDGAIWPLLAGMGLLVGQWPAWAPTAWTLLINSGLGFCLQGIAVVESLMLARGVPPSVIALTLMFVCVLAMPVFMFTTAVLGLSDFWLDFRRIDTPEGEPE